MAAAEYLWGLIEPAGVPLIISTHHNAECSEYSAVKDYRDDSKVFGGGGGSLRRSSSNQANGRDR